jgi:catechol 2,3-dioxygenase-like lactoylglutathione lyase family enzyme
MPAPKLDLIGIIARDLEASLRFYSLLGVPVPEPDGSPHLECVLPNGLRLAWDTLDLIKTIDSHWVEPQGTRLGLAFLCESPAAVDETYRTVVQAGFASHREPWDAFWGQRYAQVQDPDGNVVDLFAPSSEEVTEPDA